MENGVSAVCMKLALLSMPPLPPLLLQKANKLIIFRP